MRKVLHSLDESLISLIAYLCIVLQISIAALVAALDAIP